jgi:hypothetical protein
MPQRPGSANPNNRGPGLKVMFEVKHMTKPLIPTRLSEIEASEIEVFVSDGVMSTKKETIFDTKHFLTFRVKIPHLKSELRRQDKDFNLLQAYLVRAYPNVIVPPIRQCKPQKQVAAKYINKRQVLLSRFLRNVLRKRILRGDPFLMAFVSETDEKQFKKTCDEMIKFKNVTRIWELVTEEG